MNAKNGENRVLARKAGFFIPHSCQNTIEGIILNLGLRFATTRQPYYFARSRAGIQ